MKALPESASVGTIRDTLGQLARRQDTDALCR
jgi:hypothetical protein